MEFTAKSLYGLEEVLSAELSELGASNIRVVNRAVRFSGDQTLLYRVNYCSRTALSVLVQLSEFRIRSKDDLYRKAHSLDWSEVMDADTSFSVNAVVNSALFEHNRYPALVVKDAIADYFRKKTGRRPSVDANDPRLLINLHISHEQVNISLDSSGIPLYRRAYRTAPATAPLNEVLAAGILRISGWDKTLPLYDPMCGSGTFSAEAAMLACNIPPGRFRKSFGFTRWPGYENNLFEKVKADADSKICYPGITIKASDSSPDAVRAAAENFRNAGLDKIVDLKVADFKDIDVSGLPGYIMLNPPYGERIKIDEHDKLYEMIGTVLKHKCKGCKVWLISAAKDQLKKIGLKPESKITLFNGALESQLLHYEIFEGKRNDWLISKST